MLLFVIISLLLVLLHLVEYVFLLLVGMILSLESISATGTSPGRFHSIYLNYTLLLQMGTVASYSLRCSSKALSSYSLLNLPVQSGGTWTSVRAGGLVLLPVCLGQKLNKRQNVMDF